jgi:DNA-binding transcriptional ArsR family regulator
MVTTNTDPPSVDVMFKALADPTRRQLYEQLVLREGSVARLTEFARVSQPAVSQHIAALRRAGLLVERKLGRSTYYRAKPEALAPLVDWIAIQNRLWHDALRRLDKLLKDTGK